MAASRARSWALAAVALVAGLWLASIESRPGFDDTGVMVGLLLVVPAVVAAVAGRRPWLWALLVGGPIPLVEVASTGSMAPLAALVVAGLGAAIGWLIGRAARSSRA